MSDRSLDEFVPDAESDGESNATGGPESTESVVQESTTVDPAAATATVSPGGTACDACGETATRRWHDDGQYVCRACKEW
ncbi:MAG: formylmethanofuran dehydrogenase subunit E [Natronomonas sp.]|jgi:formylmethanofuran dehydrogenase subunit E